MSLAWTIRLFLPPAFLALAFSCVQAQSTKTLIGMSLSLSGPRATTGGQMKAGVEACLQASGVIARLEVRDDGGDAARAAANIRAFGEMPGVILVLGTGDTEVTTATARAAQELRLPTIGAATGAEAVRRPEFSYLFHARASHLDEGAALTLLIDELGIEELALVHAEGKFGRDGSEGVRIEVARLAKRLSLVASLPADGDYSALVKSLASKAPPAVVLVAPSVQAAAFVRAVRASGLRSQIFALSESSIELLGRDLGSNATGIAVSQVFPLPWGAKLPLIRNYQAAMKAHVVGAPGYDSLEGCVYARLAAETLKRAGHSPTRASVYAALDGGVFDLGGYSVRFLDGDRRGSRFVEMTVIGADGRIKR